MIRQYTQKEIEDRLQTIPEKVRDALTSIDFAKKINTIGEELFLHIDDIGEIITEVGLVALGLSNKNDFVENIKERLQTNDQEARLIAERVDKEVFASIKEYLISSPITQEQIIAEIEKEPEIPPLVTQKLSLPEKVTPSEQKLVPPPAPLIEKKIISDPYREPIE